MTTNVLKALSAMTVSILRSRPPQTRNPVSLPTLLTAEKNLKESKWTEGTSLTKAEVEENLDIKVKVKELRIYADHQGQFQIPSEYRSDATSGSNLKSLVVALYSENKLLNRLVKYKGNQLLFLHNFTVLFDDNITQ